MIKPNRLQQGDTVAVLSLSSGAAHVFPHILNKGIETIRSYGLRVKEYPTTRAAPDYLVENPQERAKDLMSAFLDPEVKGIISSIGGEDAVRILSYLDYNLIKQHPKLLMGYSDASAYLTSINAKGLVTFNGPSVMAGLAQASNLENDFQKHVRFMLFDAQENYDFPIFRQFSQGYPDWNDKTTTGQTKEQENNTGPRWIHGSSMEGILFGGCVEVLNMVNGTSFWPSFEFFSDRVLFLETSEDVPPPSLTEYTLRNYGAQGILAKLNGLMIGRSRGYSKKMQDELELSITQVLKEYDREDLPVVVNMSFGHTDPQLILPLGIRIRVNNQGILTLLENPYSN